MTRLLKTTTAPAAALLAMAFAAMMTPASAGDYCATNTSGMRGCGYYTMEQCQASTSGVYGSCYRDPFLANSSNALAYAPKSHHSKTVKKPVESQ